MPVRNTINEDRANYIWTHKLEELVARLFPGPEIEVRVSDPSTRNLFAAAEEL